MGIPVLGICYGAQLMMQQLGGRVEKAEHREFGKAELDILYTGGIFAGMETAPTRYQVWMKPTATASRRPRPALPPPPPVPIPLSRPFATKANPLSRCSFIPRWPIH